MKKIVTLLFFVSMVTYVAGQELATSASPKKSSGAAFKWSETTHDFGKTKAGTPVSHEFTFENTGLVPIVITSVKASCGCTVTAYTKEPIESGGSGFVRATYDAAKTGVYSKTVTVSANTSDGTIQLTVKGEIVN
jgi:hypothetical protein